MTKEQLQARLAQLQTEQKTANALYDGAIQDCNYWLTQFDKPVEIVEETK